MTITASGIRTRVGVRGAYVILSHERGGEMTSISLGEDDRRRIILGLLDRMPIEQRVRLAGDLVSDLPLVRVVDERPVAPDALARTGGGVR